MTHLTPSDALQTIAYSKTGPVAQVVLDRPDVINAYNVRMRDELYGVMEAVRDDPEVRVAVLSGAGDKGFCAGADLTEFGTAPSQVIARDVRWERDVWGHVSQPGETPGGSASRMGRRLWSRDGVSVRHTDCLGRRGLPHA